MKPTLLVLAAGMGSRYGGVKQIDAVGLHGETLLDFSTYDARQSGYGNVVYIIRKDIEKDFRERLFDRVAANMDADYVFQTPDAFLNDVQRETAAASGRKKPWGTVHAVLCAAKKLKAPFTVINADDYYGRTAYQSMAAYLSGVPADGWEHAMVGYTLANTLSPSGTVTRGLCVVKDGILLAMDEQKNIGRDTEKGGQGIYSIIDDKKVALTGKEWVSMNLFGFTLSALPYFDEYFESFIAENAGSPKAEALLPEAVNALVRDGRGAVRVFTSEEAWFGMTYPEDRETVRAGIAAKIKTGYYPEKLWEKG